MQRHVLPKDFNSYGSRRGNHEIMMRGTFANIRIRNEMVPGVEGRITSIIPRVSRWRSTSDSKRA
jgi:aconitate hydratase